MITKSLYKQRLIIMFNTMLLGNSMGAWIFTIILILSSLFLAKLTYKIIGIVFKKHTDKSNSKLDSILIDMLREPFVFALAIIGIWYSLQTLQFNDKIENIISNAYYILIVFDSAWLVVRFLDAMIERYIVPFTQATETQLDDQLLPIIRKSIKATVWILAILVALNNAGYDVSAILASLGIGGLAFALAAKDTVANLFGSLTIFLDEPFEIGDRVIVNGYDGFIEDVGLRSTRLRLLNGRIVTMSNSSMTNSPVENITSEPSRSVNLTLALVYNTSDKEMQKAIDILKEAVKINILLEDECIVYFNSFGDFSLNIIFIYKIRKESSIFEGQSTVNLEILRRFNKEKLEFAFPTQTIFTHKEN